MAQTSITILGKIQLRAEMRGAEGQYGFHLIKDGAVIEMSPYVPSPVYLFNLSESGTYSVKSFAKSADGIRIAESTSKEIAFQELPSTESSQESQEFIQVVGTTKESLAAALILQETFTIHSFLNEGNTSSTGDLAGIPIVNQPLKHGQIVRQKPQTKSLRPQPLTFSFIAGDYENVLLRALEPLGMLSIHQLSRKLLSFGLHDACDFLTHYGRERYACMLPPTVEIGERTALGYGGLGIVINKNSRIGKECIIGQNVTLGARSMDSVPIIGNNVYIGPGSICLGGKIGNNVVVGAGSVVTKPIPDNCVVAGVPAKIVSKDMDLYRGYTRFKGDLTRQG